MAFVSTLNRTRATPSVDIPEAVAYADPVAMTLLADRPSSSHVSGIGLFPSQGTQLGRMSGGLGIFGIDDAIIASAIPSIVSAIGGVKAKGAAVSDPVSAVWQALPASAVNAHVGSDGWWYDNTDGHQLSHTEAALRQQQVTAASISATVTPSGWWADSVDGHQLTHAEAWGRYQALQAGQDPRSAGATTAGTPMVGGVAYPSYPNITARPYVAPQQAGMFGNLSPTMLLIVAAGVIGAVVMAKRRPAR